MRKWQFTSVRRVSRLPLGSVVLLILSITPAFAIESHLRQELALLGFDRGILDEGEIRFLLHRQALHSFDSPLPNPLPPAEEYSLKRIFLEQHEQESLDEFQQRILRISETLTRESFLSLAKELQPSPNFRKRWSLTPMTLNQFPQDERSAISRLAPGEVSPPIFRNGSATFYLRE